MITILSAQFANEDGTAVVLQTQERGSVVISEKDRPDLWAEYLKWGGIPSPLPVTDISAGDLAALNKVLTDEGSVVRALAEIVFGIIKGTILVTPTITKTQFINLLQSKMRS